MTWIIYGGLALLMFYMMSRGGGCCGGGHANHGGHGSSHESGHGGGGCCGSEHGDNSGGHGEHTMNRSVGSVQDPECGMYVSKQDAVTRQINGNLYYFCSQRCADEFERKRRVS